MLSRNLPKFGPLVKVACRRFLPRHSNILQVAIRLSSNLAAPPQSQQYPFLENNAAYKFLKFHPKYVEMFFDPSSAAFEKVDSAVVNRFSASANKGVDLRGSDFDSSEVDHIICQLPNLSDVELKMLLYQTTLPAELPSVEAQNFSRLWKGLDAECNSRFRTWTFNELFVVSEFWYLNRLHRYTDFHWSVVKKMFRKCERLTSAEFIRFLFSLNLIRKIPESINTYELEHCLKKHIDELSAEELSIAAMGFFKTKTPIRDFDLFGKFMEKVMPEAKSLDSVFVAAISKVGRLSGHGKTSAILYSFQEAFLPEIDRLDFAAAMHVAIIGTRTQVFHEPLLRTVLRKAEAEVHNLRIKDMERLLLALTMFDMNCDSFCHKIVEELHSPSRESEKSIHGKCIPALLFYMSMRNIYPHDLISSIMDKEFLKINYGHKMDKFPRDLLCLDFMVGIDCPDYQGNRLPEKIRRTATRYNLLWLWPETKMKVSAYEQSVRTATEYLRKALGGKEYVHTCNVLPQFHSADVVFFTDKNDRPVKVPESYKEIEIHDVKYIPQEFRDANVVAHALLVCSYNFVVRNRPRTLLGNVKQQLRLLTKIGYKVHVAFPEDINFETNETEQDRKARAKFFSGIVGGRAAARI